MYQYLSPWIPSNALLTVYGIFGVSGCRLDIVLKCCQVCVCVCLYKNVSVFFLHKYFVFNWLLLAFLSAKVLEISFDFFFFIFLYFPYFCHKIVLSFRITKIPQPVIYVQIFHVNVSIAVSWKFHETFTIFLWKWKRCFGKILVLQLFI